MWSVKLAWPHQHIFKPTNSNSRYGSCLCLWPCTQLFSCTCWALKRHSVYYSTPDVLYVQLIAAGCAGCKIQENPGHEHGAARPDMFVQVFCKTSLEHQSLPSLVFLLDLRKQLYSGCTTTRFTFPVCTFACDAPSILCTDQYNHKRRKMSY